MRTAIGRESAQIAEVPCITVTSPNTAVNWGRGSTQQIKWSHNLGSRSSVRIELSRDGGLTFPEVLAADLKNSASSSGLFNWQVTGPNTTQAIVRVTWTAGPTADVSNLAFTIADPYITATSPSSPSTSWGYGSTQRVKWQTNLGPWDTVSVLLSTDGGSTFPTTLASSAVASAPLADVPVPALAAPTAAARARVVWNNAPTGQTAAGTTPVNFRVEGNWVTVTLPNGGETWVIGTTATVKWSSNMGSTARFNIYLSTDDGASYPNVIAANTLNDGSRSSRCRPPG